jgi:hypothetical protein
MNIMVHVPSDGVACSRDLQPAVGNSKNRKKIEAENPLQKWQIRRRFRLDICSILENRRTDAIESNKYRRKIGLTERASDTYVV